MTLPNSSQETLRKRHSIIKDCRYFFEEKHDFVEVITPTLVANPGLEPHIEYFETNFVDNMGTRPTETLFLPTSPEYHLKRALAMGLDRIFEIKSSFRNGEFSPRHRPEFLMLEWYRHPGSYKDIGQDTQDLFAFLAEKHALNPQVWTKTRHLSVCDAFLEYCSIDLEKLLREGNQNDLALLAIEKGIHGVNASASFDEAFHFLIVDKIEKALSPDEITFLWDYPMEFATLARQHPSKPYLAERFEVYVGPLELGNAFGELTDQKAQRLRCQKDLEERQKNYPNASLPPLDEKFLKSLDDLNEAGGIAIGLERLIMGLLNLKNLSDLRVFE